MMQIILIFGPSMFITFSARLPCRLLDRPLTPLCTHLQMKKARMKVLHLSSAVISWLWRGLVQLLNKLKLSSPHQSQWQQICQAGEFLDHGLLLRNLLSQSGLRCEPNRDVLIPQYVFLWAAIFRLILVGSLLHHQSLSI